MQRMQPKRTTKKNSTKNSMHEWKFLWQKSTQHNGSVHFQFSRNATFRISYLNPVVSFLTHISSFLFLKRLDFFLEIVRFSFQGDRNSFTFIFPQFTPCKLMCLILLSIETLRISFIVKYHNVKNCKLDILCCLSLYSLCVVYSLSGIGKCMKSAPI